MPSRSGLSRGRPTFGACEIGLRERQGHHVVGRVVAKPRGRIDRVPGELAGVDAAYAQGHLHGVRPLPCTEAPDPRWGKGRNRLGAIGAGKRFVPPVGRRPRIGRDWHHAAVTHERRAAAHRAAAIGRRAAARARRDNPPNISRGACHQPRAGNNRQERRHREPPSLTHPYFLAQWTKRRQAHLFYVLAAPFQR